VLRQLNAAAVLNVLRTAGPLRVSDLAVRTGLTRPTIAQALSLLEAEGWVLTSPDMSGQRIGRPAQLVRFHAGAGHVLGVDIGPHKVLAAVADLAGAVIAEYRADTSSARSGVEVMAVAETTMHAVLRQSGLSADRLYAVGLGTPGVVDARRGTVLLAPSIPGWASLPLVDQLKDQFRCPIVIDNDVNLAVLAERSYSDVGKVDTLAFVQWGARLGAGIVIGGKLHRGAASAAGEIGFLDLEESPGLLRDMGAFERMVGTDAIAELAAVNGVPRDSGADPSDISAVLRDAAAGDAAAMRVVDTVAARFARGIAPLLLILDPDLVVIGGGVSGGGPVLLDAVTRHLAGRTLVPPRLALSKLGDRAVALGAVRLALSNVEERLFTASAFAQRAARSPTTA
jgi:predicted NBD/HSP70 family sugar kinase